MCEHLDHSYIYIFSHQESGVDPRFLHIIYGIHGYNGTSPISAVNYHSIQWSVGCTPEIKELLLVLILQCANHCRMLVDLLKLENQCQLSSPFVCQI